MSSQVKTWIHSSILNIGQFLGAILGFLEGFFVMPLSILYTSVPFYFFRKPFRQWVSGPNMDSQLQAVLELLQFVSWWFDFYKNWHTNSFWDGPHDDDRKIEIRISAISQSKHSLFERSFDKNYSLSFAAPTKLPPTTDLKASQSRWKVLSQ